MANSLHHNSWGSMGFFSTFRRLSFNANDNGCGAWLSSCVVLCLLLLAPHVSEVLLPGERTFGYFEGVAILKEWCFGRLDENQLPSRSWLERINVTLWALESLDRDSL